jgi:glutamate synthase domain-containing protein 3
MNTGFNFVRHNTPEYNKHSLQKLVELENRKEKLEKQRAEAIELLRKQKASQKGRVALRNARLAKASKQKYLERQYSPK